MVKSWSLIFHSFSKARELVERVVQRAQGGGQGAGGPPGMGGVESMSDNLIEVLIPGPKVGLVIGKGGDTIKQLQVCNFYMMFLAYIFSYLLLVIQFNSSHLSTYFPSYGMSC